LLSGVLVVLAVLNFVFLSPRIFRAVANSNFNDVAKWKKWLSASGMLALISATGKLVISSVMRYQ
jgi:hypothetical protein